MASIICPNCHKAVSDTERNCIHCGFNIAETLCKGTKEPIRKNDKRIFTKKQLSLFRSLLVAVVVAVVLILSSVIKGMMTDKDVFEKLYYGPTREEVLSEMGQPDDSTYSEGKIWFDFYNNVEFLGETGRLTVHYQATGSVTGAHFEVIWTNPDTDDKQRADEYGNDIIAFYTRKHGEQKEDAWAGDHWSATSVDIITIYCGPNTSGNWGISLWLK